MAKQKGSTRSGTGWMGEGYAFRTLPDYLQPGLDLVFVGINPGLYSVQRGHYFARLTSRFWPAFSASKLSERVRRALGTDTLRAEHDAELPRFGIGFTDVVKRPSANAADLNADDFKKWAASARETPALPAARGVLSRADGLSAVPRPRAEMRRQAANARSPAGAHRRDSALRRAEPQSSQRPFHAHRPDCVVRPSGRVPGCCEDQRLNAIRASGMFGHPELTATVCGKRISTLSAAPTGEPSNRFCYSAR